MGAKKYSRKKWGARLLTAAAIILFIALVLTIFFGERLMREREKRILNSRYKSMTTCIYNNIINGVQQ